MINNSGNISIRGAVENGKNWKRKKKKSRGVSGHTLHWHSRALEGRARVGFQKHFVNVFAGLLRCHSCRDDNGKRIYSINLAGKSEAPSPFLSKRDNILMETE
jgi:hypothetical protein